MIALVSALFMLTLFPISVGPWVGVLAVIAVMSGALTPDLDQPTATIWRRMIGANTLGNIFQVFSGGHRHFTHSLLGIGLVGWGLHWLMSTFLQPAYVSAAVIIWYAFLVGYISHPIADTVTDRGVPWLWPLPWNIRIPPGPEEVRVTTDSLVERVLVRGGALIVAASLLYNHGDVVIGFFSRVS